MSFIAENLKRIREEIAEACLKAGRKPQEVALLAVSKTHPAEAILEAYAAGQRLFGESYAQEYGAKAAEIEAQGDCPKIEWHYIGALQTNKAKYIAGKTALIHSVDSLKLALEIDKRAKNVGAVQAILVEVNTGGEESKAGAASDELFRLLEQIGSMENLRCEGLMTLPPFLPPDEVRPYFEQLYKLNEAAKSRGLLPFGKHLSMGMSGDFSAAIECGSTIVRIGTAIFGERSYAR